MHTITRGLDLPISGKPDATKIVKKPTDSVALIGFDYVNMKPTLHVDVGDKVKMGQILFDDKKSPGTVYTAPGSGKVSAIHRGHKRALESVVIELDGKDTAEKFKVPALDSLTADKARDILIRSGMWTSIRRRPFSSVPPVDSSPQALFVTAIDTNPLAVDPALVINHRREDFINGLKVLTTLVECSVYVCTNADFSVDMPDMSQVSWHQFTGKHPAGNVGTHMHFIAPAGRNVFNWHVGYQDVIAIGALFTNGTLDMSRVVALGGPEVKEPKLIETRIGACISDICADELKDEPTRVISGSVFNGRKAAGSFDWLGRYHLQVCAIKEDHDRHFLRYLSPGVNGFSVLNIYLSKLFPKSSYNFTSTTNGSERAMVPVGAYEKVMPLDILPTQLLRSLVVKDIETAEKLGALELDEEDVALCTFACPSKYEFGIILRDNLALIEKEG